MKLIYFSTSNILFLFSSNWISSFSTTTSLLLRSKKWVSTTFLRIFDTYLELRNGVNTAMGNYFGDTFTILENHETHSFTGLGRHELDVFHLPKAAEVFLHLAVFQLLGDSGNEQFFLLLVLNFLPGGFLGGRSLELDPPPEEDVSLLQDQRSDLGILVGYESKPSEFF